MPEKIFYWPKYNLLLTVNHQKEIIKCCIFQFEKSQ